MKVAFALLSVCLISGSVTASGQHLLEPVLGPQAALKPPPVSHFKFKFSVSCKVSVQQADGELFEGKCAEVKVSLPNIQKPGTPASYPPQPNLAFAWEAVYGGGYFFNHVQGARGLYQTFTTGNRGTKLQMEFFYDQVGVAVDDKGNVYKLIF